MSQENVEIVRRSYEAYVRGDSDAALAPLDPEIEIYDHDLFDAEELREQGNRHSKPPGRGSRR